MQESYGEGLATHTGPESCAGVREDAGEALTGVRPGWALSREIADMVRGADALAGSGRLHPAHRYCERRRSLARPKTPSMGGNTLRGNREVLCLSPEGGRIGKSKDARR